MKHVIEGIYIVIAICILSPALFAGCCSDKTDCPVEKSAESSEAHSAKLHETESVQPPAAAEHHKHEDENVCRSMAEGMLKAIKHADYDIFVHSLPEGCEIPVTDEEFEASSTVLEGQFGDLVDYTFLTELDTPMVHNQLWKATFHRKDSEGNPVKQDLIFRFVTAERDGCNQIIGFGFM